VTVHCKHQDWTRATAVNWQQWTALAVSKASTALHCSGFGQDGSCQLAVMATASSTSSGGLRRLECTAVVFCLNNSCTGGNSNSFNKQQWKLESIVL